ncbi:hypothetical protein POM88_043803 [Heracleum sosnowskyi]|uniref:RNase H type-1 domain-containing protein n=1 Tax=Heracleum sosnowskyi TaxID=360622 RepID=A0AAD8M4K0_9APIA|nr:hypothetical protein POM88_043803 [Heracleum sosnowskyi]
MKHNLTQEKSSTFKFMSMSRFKTKEPLLMSSIKFSTNLIILRYKVLHNIAIPQDASVVDCCISFLQEFDKYNAKQLKAIPKQGVKWKPPNRDCLKINVDAATSSERNGMGLGVVIRDHNGGVITSGMVYKNHCFGALAVELFAI